MPRTRQPPVPPPPRPNLAPPSPLPAACRPLTARDCSIKSSFPPCFPPWAFRLRGPLGGELEATHTRAQGCWGCGQLFLSVPLFPSLSLGPLGTRDRMLCLHLQL